MAFPAADRFDGVVPAGTPDWLPDDLVAVCNRGGMVWLLRDAEEGLSECRTLDGRLVSSLGIRDVFAETPPTILFGSLLVQREYLWISAKQQLLLFRQDKTLRSWQTETDIASLVPSAPFLPLCLVARLQRGVSLHWANALKENTETICAELVEPLATFTGNGTLILVAGTDGRVCEVRSTGVNEISAFNLLRDKPMAVTCAEGNNQFAVFWADGKVQVFRTSE